MNKSRRIKQWILKIYKTSWNDTKTAFEVEPLSKRRRGFPSEKAVKKGNRVVHGEKELSEKLGKEDLCPCGSGLSFQEVLSQHWKV